MGIMTTVDILDFKIDAVIAIDELDCILNNEVSDKDLVIDENDDVVDKVDTKLEDNVTEGNRVVTGFVDVTLGDVTLGVGIAILREMLVLLEILLNVTAGIIPLTALPRGVIKSRLTAVAVNEYGSERFRLSKDPSTVSFLPTTGIV